MALWRVPALVMNDYEVGKLIAKYCGGKLIAT